MYENSIIYHNIVIYMLVTKTYIFLFLSSILTLNYEMRKGIEKTSNIIVLVMKFS